ncbi:hypothetical protein DFJ58DRAFT_771743 [Suillus subalutaceus]|uniref:uncharacterized protein n=1 Tax=Suillus subalutaceus TaxID=48586 RepID=UPI001B86A4C8|nr:uncharacterized protein DFJ58DRAFT_771743 [Suillus subalutaceus]KAG1864953.1 hypothetical protein DFJ58DRAFT_771743 [Suillus subalutaceus]
MLFHFDDDWNLYCTYLSPDGPQHLDLGYPVHGCKTRIVDPDSKTVHREGEHELQVHGTIIFIHCYNDVEATSCSFVVGTAASVMLALFRTVRCYESHRDRSRVHDLFQS